MTPLLEVLTRVNDRPTMLAANQASLQAQTDADWLQTLLVDDIGRGVGWSYDNLAAYAPNLVGQWVWILDDDDLCICPTLVAQLRAITRNMKQPDVVFVRMDHGPLGVLPEPKFWGRFPVQGHIGVSAYIVRRDVWRAHAHAMTPGCYTSDYRFIAAIWESAPRVVWHDCIASRVQRISHGRRGDN